MNPRPLPWTARDRDIVLNELRGGIARFRAAARMSDDETRVYYAEVARSGARAFAILRAHPTTTKRKAKR